MEQIAVYIKDFLHPVAEISASILELIGIVIIIVGSCRALVRLIRKEKKKNTVLYEKENIWIYVYLTMVFGIYLILYGSFRTVLHICISES